MRAAIPDPIARPGALLLLCLSVPIAIISIFGGGVALLWTTATDDRYGILGALLVWGLPIMCTFAGVEAYRRGAYRWAIALTIPTLFLAAYFLASANFWR